MLLFSRLRSYDNSSNGSFLASVLVHEVLPALLPWLIPALLMVAGILLGGLAEPQVPSDVPPLSGSLRALPESSSLSHADPSPESALVLVATRFGLDPVRFLVLSEFISSQDWSGSGLFRYKDGDPLPCPLPLGPQDMDATSAYVAADQIASLVAHGWDEVDAMLFYCFGPSWSDPSPLQSSLRSALMLPEGGEISGAACEAVP